ncbi:MAG: T9SS type A sorting domain-containing protein [Flavobacteriales bacterium]|nr:T9SS type A sorting domain-containing protein [Flavobacteriales bacterium]
MKNLLLFIFFFCFSIAASGQCPAGEVELEIVVHTDTYGYEIYWELLPSGINCGTSTIASGGNTAVGCSGAGAQNQTPGGYGNNITVTEGPWCITEGEQFDFFLADDWGDGGCSFDIIINGYQITSFDGVGLGATFNFIASEPAAYDLQVFNSNLYSYVNTGSYDLEAHIFNAGVTEIDSYDLNYTVNNGVVNTHAVVGSMLSNFSSEDVEHSVPISIASNGLYIVKIWADNLNGGNADLNNSNDTLTKVIEAGPGIPNEIEAYIGAFVEAELIAGSSNQINRPTDLDFHPVLTNKELWITNKGTENSGGSTVTLFNAGESDQSYIYKQDGNAWHFMSLPTGIAFSQNGNWANSPGVYDANHNGGAAFTGPALWSSDMDIYAEPSGGNGSHLDMLHLSPYCQGIAAEVDNVFWVFDGWSDDIVRYDFAEDHGPGNDFHGDAIVWRYSDDEVDKDVNDQIVSHLVLDENAQWLYVVDHGNGRVIRIDITTGSDMGGTPDYPENEPIEEYLEITGYTQETVYEGLLKPAGIDVIEDRMIVSEYETGEILIFDISTMPATLIETISTNYSSIQGVKIGPEGKIWFVDYDSDGVYRLNAFPVGIEEQSTSFSVYPNPSNGEITIFSELNKWPLSIELTDLSGRIIFNDIMTSVKHNLDLDFASGAYFISISNDDSLIAKKKIIIQQ